jgi:Zn finger protein HypA/HybF involved in hydrogenase expression
VRQFSSGIVGLFLAAGAYSQYAGSEACKSCHPSQFAAQSKTAHARALQPAPAGTPGEWAFGAGQQAVTYVSQLDDDAYIELGLSYYTKTKSFALTPGHKDTKGVRYRTFDPAADILHCFQCHSTGPLTLGARQRIQPSETGVRCESCHGPGGAHVAAKGARQAIENPKRLTAEELNVFCGNCHRKPPTAFENTDWQDPWNTRHQPVYLSQSACFRKSKGSLSCLTCHAPHTSLSVEAADYGKRCAGCHAQARHRSPLGAKSCVECHMPEVQVNPQLRFTNHWIGIYKPRAARPVKSLP